MKIFNNHRHLLFFIGGSLLLLAVLEGFWLKKLYSDERETLREKIKQTLNINFLSMQVSVMQKRNVSLIDSFMSNREKEEKERIIIFGGVNPFKTDFTDFIKNSQKTYYLKLDSLSK